MGQCTGTINTPGHYSGVAATKSAQCTGTSLATAWGGHVNAIPAMNCYLNVLGGVPDGTSGVLPFDANTCYGAGGGSNPPSDTTPPSITMTAPASGTSVATSGGAMTVSATASDNVGVTSVQFKLDGNSLGAAVTVGPYQVFLNPATLSLGTHTLTATASDAAGNQTTATAVTITATAGAGGGGGSSSSTPAQFAQGISGYSFSSITNYSITFSNNVTAYDTLAVFM